MCSVNVPHGEWIALAPLYCTRLNQCLQAQPGFGSTVDWGFCDRRAKEAKVEAKAIYQEAKAKWARSQLKPSHPPAPKDVENPRTREDITWNRFYKCLHQAVCTPTLSLIEMHDGPRFHFEAFSHCQIIDMFYHGLGIVIN